VRPAGAAPYDRLVAGDVATWQPRTLTRLDPGQKYPGAELLADGNRVLLTVGQRQDPAAPAPGRPRLGTPLTAARVIDLATGQPAFDLSLPQAENIGRIEAVEGGYEGYDPGVFGPLPRTHRWDSSGAYLGVRDIGTSWIPGKVFDQSEVTRGSRLVRRTDTYHPSGGGMISRLEVWDTARRGPGDRPLFTLESSPYELVPYLSPDGRRLIVRRTSVAVAMFVEFEMYDTTTGRLLLRLPYMGPGPSGTGSGIWAADGSAFWRRMTLDGQFSGYDFRPLPEPTK
jgi:hypothetical protein